MHEVFEEAVARGLLQLHAKHEHAAKFNDINVRFDSSCNVPVIEDQLLGDESKCDFRRRR
jgi:hypothetical protein